MPQREEATATIAQSGSLSARSMTNSTSERSQRSNSFYARFADGEEAEPFAFTSNDFGFNSSSSGDVTPKSASTEATSAAVEVAAPEATLESFFTAIGRPHQAKLFDEQGVSYDTLLTLQDEDLGDLGLPASDVKAILAQIQAVRANARKSATEPTGNGCHHVVEPANSKHAAIKTTTAPPSSNVKSKPSSTASFYSAFS